MILKPTIAAKVLMVRPRSFRANEETLHDNAFQSATIKIENASLLAQTEFDALKANLEKHGIDVVVFDEPEKVDAPDSLFPNNWFASMPGGQAYLFPMLALNRRREVHPEWIHSVLPKSELTDLRHLERDGVYLEGTGSMIFDHAARVGYACYSARTQKSALEEFAKISGYKMIGFEARDENGGEYYHTNVIMAIGSRVAVLCTEAIVNVNERQTVLSQLTSSGHKVLEITRKQVAEFAGNMIELTNKTGERFWICSERAWASLADDQRQILSSDATVIRTALPTIERLGGGGARCMIGEIF